MAPRRLFDQLGRPYDLGQQFAVGGEGALFDIPAASQQVAKVYLKHDPQQGEKLRSMIGMAQAELLRSVAWPTATLHERPNGPVVGFLMPKAAGFKEIHRLYSSAERKHLFPQADWAFLIHTAMNCALAFDLVHSRGHVMADVNQKNVMVSADATVYLIDCDSYQVRANGRVFTCDV